MDPNTLFATGHIATWLLISGLVFPRLSLFVAFFVPGSYPPNSLPDLVNFFGWLFVPRFLMAFYIYADIGTSNVWFWAYLLIGIGGLFGESGYVRHRVTRRTTVSRDGHTTTTVEEEEV